ncbi:hypothetical protein IEO21_06076 [Rhodonia placenta]|uniref:F-box domain-containing protein n=1 Tax=Rhodonia placenta TaxID=104341 RepID=A0A8H7P0Q4_9APHY|nr:hypothetical protein IEO21_06076 [Postia placenta]
MATRIITDLPVELLVMIFFFLDARDLMNCKQHMRRTAELVPGTSFPQWTALAWTTAPGGLFAQANKEGGIDFIQLPSAVLGVSERRWSIHSDRLEMEMETMCMDPSQDVVVVTGWNQVPNGPEGRYPALRILSFTDGQPHRLAARSEINLSDTGRYDEQDNVEAYRREGRQTRVEGDYVAHLGSWNHEYTVLVWDWKTGDLLWESINTVITQHLQQTSPENKHNSFDFIDSRHLLASDDRAIDIFVLDRPSTYTGVPAFIRGSLCMWEYPIREGQSFTCNQLMSTHKGGCPQRNTAHPFYPSPQHGLVAVACYGAPYGDVPASMIREWALRAQTRAQTRAQNEDTFRVGDSGLVEWAHWAPYYPRMFRNGRPFSAEVQGMHATFANVEGEELVLDHIDYTAVGSNEVEFDFWTHRDRGDEWDEDNELCVIPEDSEGVHSAYAEAQPTVGHIPQYLVILPDYAILQEYEDDDGDNQWQIYHIVASDSGDS